MREYKERFTAEPNRCCAIEMTADQRKRAFKRCKVINKNDAMVTVAVPYELIAVRGILRVQGREASPDNFVEVANQTLKTDYRAFPENTPEEKKVKQIVALYQEKLAERGLGHLDDLLMPPPKEPKLTFEALVQEALNEPEPEKAPIKKETLATSKPVPKQPDVPVKPVTETAPTQPTAVPTPPMTDVEEFLGTRLTETPAPKAQQEAPSSFHMPSVPGPKPERLIPADEFELAEVKLEDENGNNILDDAYLEAILNNDLQVPSPTLPEPPKPTQAASTPTAAPPADADPYGDFF